MTCAPRDRRGLPEAAFVEAILDAPYASVWALASDLEHGVPQFESAVQALEILGREGDTLQIAVQLTSGGRLGMDAVLRDGYCLMQSDVVAIGMAAQAEGRGTRFAHFECIRGRPLDHALETKLAAELRAIEALGRAHAAPSR